MPTMYEQLKAALPGAKFHPPATEAQIARVEKALATNFPEWLRELYLCTNGIQGERFHDPYLYGLEPSDDFGDSLLTWNQFLRDELDRNWANYPDAAAATDWEMLHVRHLLIIGGQNGINWAINPSGGPEIIDYTVREPESREVLAADLVEMCIKNEEEDSAIHKQLFQGRKPLRRGLDPLPASNDVELILETLIELYRGTKKIPMSAREATGPGWSLCQATSRRPGEGGMLFIFKRGGVEIQAATEDGNVPMVLRARVGFQEEPLRVLVKDLPEMVLCMLYLVDVHPWSVVDDKKLMEDKAGRARHVWQHRYGPPNPELEAKADVLFGRDDRRLEEENRIEG